MTESFEGEPKLGDFVTGYARLLDMIAAASGASPRMVLLSPNYHENLGRPLPDPTDHNKNLELYRDAIRDLSQQRNYKFIDLLTLTKPTPGRPATVGPLTENGIHLSAFGYAFVAEAIDQQLFGPRTARLDLDAEGKVLNAVGLGAKVSRLGGGLSIQVTPHSLPAPAALVNGSITRRVNTPSLSVSGEPQGRYAISTAKASAGDDRPAAIGVSQQDLAAGVPLPGVEGHQQQDELRKLIVAKNSDYFNYWRPQNDTYILGYRKHEQGKNAVELPQFKPLAEAKDQRIAALRVPRPVTYTLEKQ